MTLRFRWPMFSIMLPLLAAASASAQTNAWDLGHPDAKLMLGINLKNLRESALGQAFRSQMGAQTPQLGPAGMALGFLEQIDRVFLSSPAISSPRSKTAATAAPRENPPFLVIVEGMLPVQQLMAFLPGSLQRYRSVDVFRGAKATDPSIAALDARTMVIGDEKSVLAAIDRRENPVPAASATLTRARELVSTHDFWMLATDDLSKFQPANTTFPSALAGEVKGIDIGMAVHDGFQFEMSMTMASETAAAQLMQLVSAQIALAQAQNPDVVEAVRKLQLGSQGNQIRASISLRKEEFEQQLRNFQAARANAGRSSGAPLVPPARPRAPQPPAQPGKIKIYGLDEGVREIPLTR